MTELSIVAMPMYDESRCWIAGQAPAHLRPLIDDYLEPAARWVRTGTWCRSCAGRRVAASPARSAAGGVNVFLLLATAPAGGAAAVKSWLGRTCHRRSPVSIRFAG